MSSLARVMAAPRRLLGQSSSMSYPVYIAKPIPLRPQKCKLLTRAIAGVKEESTVPGMTAWLDTLKYDAHDLVTAVCQHVDTGEVLMLAYCDRAALNETMQTGKATFYSRSRQERWCKGETSGNYLRVTGVYADCDRDALIFLCDPLGPSCHTGARTCWFEQARLDEDGNLLVGGESTDPGHVPRTSLLALEHTILERAQANTSAASSGTISEKPSWTARLLADPKLACKKIREEAGELCETWEKEEGRERTVSEAADLLYHAMALLRTQDVAAEEVLAELRRRFGVSGIEEKASRGPRKA
jgi:phosphoribosyl-AMP cyclohydrolase / phosphoribosyl-ATP pyrophosphohydrolase